jgi:FAD/FMN-containing dehydrogenase
VIASVDVRGLRGTIDGQVIVPGDERYESRRRVWNGMIDRRPAAIVEAAAVDDVAPTIAFARSSGLPLAIRGGGHNVAGNGTVDRGLVLDLGRLNGVTVDPGSGLVRVAAGARLGDIDRATEPFDLAVPIGVVSGTGVAGLTLGGGIGWLLRPHGLTIDNLVEAEVVLADGARVRASESENSDLFWGLRGGGGNFGVVTSFVFRAHPLDHDVFAGTLVYDARHWRNALRALAQWAGDLPDAMTTLTTLMVPPAAWDMGGKPLMFLGFAWASPDRAAGEAEIAKLRAAAPPDAAVVDPIRWLTFQSAFDPLVPDGVRAYWRNASFERLDEPLIDALVEHCAAQRYGTALDVHHMGGAFGRIPEDATAFPNRSALFWVNVYGFWPDAVDDAPLTAWVKRCSDGLQPFAMPGQYVNFLGLDEDDPRRKALATYGPVRLERLVALKSRYDPENVFRINHNIPPAEPPSTG